MTGYLILLVVIAASIGALWVLGLRSGMLQAAAAALLLGGAGYAFQGRPGTPGSPARGAEAPDIAPLDSARHAFFGEFTPAESWLRMSDALASRGNSEDAANLLQSAVRQHPNDPQLWIGFGNALVDHAHVLTPAAEFAYRRAAELAPGHPAAPFFMGLALARSGERQAALDIWRSMLESAPPKAGWRPLVEAGIEALESSPPKPR